MSVRGFLTQQGYGSEAEAQREADNQRWADDGGRIPDAPVARTYTPAPSPSVRTGVPVRVIYRRGEIT